ISNDGTVIRASWGCHFFPLYSSVEGRCFPARFSLPFGRSTNMTKSSHASVELHLTAKHLNQYCAEKITLRQLADSYRVSVSTVWRELKRQGVCRGSRRGRPQNREKHPVVVALAEQGCSRQQIAERLGITPEWVRCILAEYGMAASLQLLKCHCCGATVA